MADPRIEQQYTELQDKYDSAMEARRIKIGQRWIAGIFSVAVVAGSAGYIIHETNGRTEYINNKKAELAPEITATLAEEYVKRAGVAEYVAEQMKRGVQTIPPPVFTEKFDPGERDKKIEHAANHDFSNRIGYTAATMAGLTAPLCAVWLAVSGFAAARKTKREAEADREAAMRRLSLAPVESLSREVA